IFFKPLDITAETVAHIGWTGCQGAVIEFHFHAHVMLVAEGGSLLNPLIPDLLLEEVIRLNPGEVELEVLPPVIPVGMPVWDPYEFEFLRADIVSKGDQDVGAAGHIFVDPVEPDQFEVLQSCLPVALQETVDVPFT